MISSPNRRFDSDRDLELEKEARKEWTESLIQLDRRRHVRFLTLAAALAGLALIEGCQRVL